MKGISLFTQTTKNIFSHLPQVISIPDSSPDLTCPGMELSVSEISAFTLMQYSFAEFWLWCSQRWKKMQPVFPVFLLLLIIHGSLCQQFSLELLSSEEIVPMKTIKHMFLF